MKIIYAFALIFCINAATFAQKYVPQIKTGTVFNFSAYSKAFGQDVPLTLTVLSITAPFQLKFNVPQLGIGTFEMSAKAMESGKKMAFKEPEIDGVTKLKDDETLAVLSKNTFTNLTTNKTFELNGQTFNVTADTSPYKINDKEADVFYAVTANGKTKLWILNNPDFPLICKLEGGPQGIDLSLNSIQEYVNYQTSSYLKVRWHDAPSYQTEPEQPKHIDVLTPKRRCLLRGRSPGKRP